jgi:hypothetical protein
MFYMTAGFPGGRTSYFHGIVQCYLFMAASGINTVGADMQRRLQVTRNSGRRSLAPTPAEIAKFGRNCIVLAGAS